MEQRPIFGSLGSALAGGAIVMVAGGVGAAMLPLVWTPPRPAKPEAKIFPQSVPQAAPLPGPGRLDPAGLSQLIATKREDPVAAAFGAKFLANPTLKALWDKYQQDADFAGMYHALMASPDFDAIFRPAGQDPLFRASLDPLMAEPKVQAALDYAQTHEHDPPAQQAAPRPAGRLILPEMDEDLVGSDLAFRRKTNLASRVLLGMGALLGLLAWLRRPRRQESETAASPQATGVPAPRPAAVQPAFSEKYETVRVLGSSAGAQLLEARDKQLDRLVLIHRLAGGDVFRRRALTEAPRTAAGVRHPALIEVYEIAEDGNDVCVVYERCAGKSVAQLVTESGPMPLPRAVEILEPVCLALEAAHARGVFHRWLAPERILVTDQGFTKVIGLGLSQSTGGDGRQDDVRALGACLSRMTAAGPGVLQSLTSDSSGPKPSIHTAAEFLARMRRQAAPESVI